MFTLCPHCETVHPLTAALLAQAGGWMQCGDCDKRFNALDRLYDEFPDGKAQPAPTAAQWSPPELRRRSEPEAATPAAIEKELKPPRAHWIWLALVPVLLALTAINIVWTFRDHLPRDGAIAGFLESRDVAGFEPEPAFDEPGRIHLVTRDIHPHPTREDVLVLSATFVNLADRPQPYPVLSVALMDVDNRPVVARNFDPADYLTTGWATGERLQPDQHVPILLEFADPGEKAVGFELDFLKQGNNN